MNKPKQKCASDPVNRVPLDWLRASLLILAVFIAPAHADDLTKRANHGQLSLSASTLNFGLVEIGDRASQRLTVKNTGKSRSDILQISTLYLDERDAANYATDVSGNISLQPGESRDLNIYFDPKDEGLTPGMLFITHSGRETVSIVNLEGIGIDSFLGSGLAPPILGEATGEGSVAFVKSSLNGMNPVNATSIQFGPDNRLYAAALNGEILIYDVQRDGINQYLSLIHI